MTSVVALQGGLGNQLFQLSFARALTTKEKGPIHLHFMNGTDKYRIKDLISLSQNSNIFSNLPLQYKFHKNFFFRREPRVAIYHERNLMQLLPILNENYRQFASDIQESTNSYFIGTFASPKYWYPSNYKEYADWILNLLSVQLDISKSYPQYGISIHARRGDYIQNVRTRNFHGYCSTDYYLKALKCLTDQGLAENGVLISSDEPGFSQYLKSRVSKQIGYVDVLLEEDAVISLLRLSRTESFIGSNSTFSWWASYLAERKMRVFPSNWYLSSRITFDKSDLFPDSPLFIDEPLLS